METFDNGRLGLYGCKGQSPERGLGLLRPRLNVGPVCDDSATERTNAALYK